MTVSTVKIRIQLDDPFCHQGYDMSKWLVSQGLVEYRDFDWIPVGSGIMNQMGFMVFKFFDCEEIVPIFVLRWS